MSRVALVHQKPSEAESQIELLRRAGHQVRLLGRDIREELPAFRKRAPDVFVIDLVRSPSHGLALATYLRQQKPTRRVPLVFAGGELEKVARVRELLPDAEYVEWRRIRGAVRRARSPDNPVVPGTMAGYSGTPLPKKLGIKPGSQVALVGAPAGFEATLGDLPQGAEVRRQARGNPTLVMLFVRSRADLKRRFPAASLAVAEKGGLWIVWPKKTTKLAGDLTQQEVRAFGLDASWVDYKICAIDETWSGLLFARRGAEKA